MISQLFERNKELAELKERVCETLKEVEKKGLELSISEGSKGGKSEVLASCRYLEEKLRDCSKSEGVVLAKSVEMHGVDLRTQTKQLGANEKAVKKKCKVGFSRIRKNTTSQNSYMRIGATKLWRTGLVLAREGKPRRSRYRPLCSWK